MICPLRGRVYRPPNNGCLLGHSAIHYYPIRISLFCRWFRGRSCIIRFWSWQNLVREPCPKCCSFGCLSFARNFARGGGGGATGKGSCPKWHHYGLFVANSGARTMPEILRFRVLEPCPKFCAWGWAHVNQYKMPEKVTCKISGAIRAHRSAKFRAWFGQWFFRPFRVEWISDVW